MKVCAHNGLSIVVLTRNEHCPPHVHVGSDKWEARFEFSFWHNDVSLWDVTPVQNQPTKTVLEGLRQTLKKPVNLRRAREIWWDCLQSVCLINQRWDGALNEVVDTAAGNPQSKLIQAASFDRTKYQTVLQLAGQSDPVEIWL